MGADAVIGQESHRLYGMELIDGKPVIYSLADLIFGLYDKLHARTVMTKLTFEAGRARSIKLIPISVDDPSNRCQPRVLSGDKAEESLREYARLCEKLGTKVEIEGGKGRISNE